MLATVWETGAERQALGRLAQRARNVAQALAQGLLMQARYSWQAVLARQITAARRERGSLPDGVHVEHQRGAEYGRLVLTALRPLAGSPIPGRVHS
jgi:hypothetical protein